MSKKYQVFTPKHVVNVILDDIGYCGPSIIQKRIIDISCGDGAFLCEALKRLLIECKKQSMPINQMIETITNNIIGFEIDENYIRDCYRKLNEIVRESISDKKRTFKWKNIHDSDGLLIDDSEKFDFVVGNPPYISYKEMGNEKRKQLFDNFETCKNWRFDYSYAFIEKSINILKEDGVCSIISPINMFKIKSGERLRNFIRPFLYKVIDVTEDNIFPGVLTNPVISFFNKKEKSDFILFGKKDNYKSILIDEFYNKSNCEFLSDKSNRFGDYYDVCNGVATLLNKAFIVQDDSTIEEALLYNACSPKQKRYGYSEKIIFPYLFVKGEFKRIEEEAFINKYPNAYNHLLIFKEELLKRDIDSKNKWYEYGRSQAITKMNCDKIMMPTIVSENYKPIMLGKKDVVYAGFMITSKNEKEHPLSNAFEILNKNGFYDYIKKIGVKMNGNSYRYSVNDLKNYKF